MKRERRTLPMGCNIDARGRAVRLLSGIVFLLVGAALSIHAWYGEGASTWVWVPGTLLVVIGAFQIYEGWVGWCVVRAMGFKTKI